MDLIETILNAHGPMLTSRLGKILSEEYGLSPEAARQQISRKKTLFRLNYIPFPKRARFVYLQPQFMSSYYWRGLERAVIESKSAYGLAWSAMEVRGGIVPRSHFPIICGAPLKQLKHLSPDLILDRMIRSKILEEVEVAGVGPCIALTQYWGKMNQDDLLASFRSRMIVENVLIKAVKSWAKRLGLVSFNKVSIRDEGTSQPQVGTFNWDLTGPSYLSPMTRWSNEELKPGFLTCDVVLGRRVRSEAMQTFLNKCLTLKSLKKVGKTLHIFVGEDFESEAYAAAKQEGIIATTPAALFGREIAEGLKDLTRMLKRVTLSSPEMIVQLFNKLSEIEGAASNLRGALFELMVGNLVQKGTGAAIRINQKYKTELGEAEVDVIAIRGDSTIHFIECKGHHPSGQVRDEQVEKWLFKTIPVVKAFAKTHSDWKNFNLIFEFWTSGTFTAESLIKLKDAQANTKKYTVEYKDSEALLEYARQVKDGALLAILKAHFLEHPLSKIERQLIISLQ